MIVYVSIVVSLRGNCKSMICHNISGAGDRVRTDDSLLGRQILYQLSYARNPLLPTSTGIPHNLLLWHLYCLCFHRSVLLNLLMWCFAFFGFCCFCFGTRINHFYSPIVGLELAILQLAKLFKNVILCGE